MRESQYIDGSVETLGATDGVDDSGSDRGGDAGVRTCAQVADGLSRTDESPAPGCAAATPDAGAISVIPLVKLAQRATDEQLAELLADVRAAAKRELEKTGKHYPIATEWAVRRLCLGRDMSEMYRLPRPMYEWCRERLRKIIETEEG